METNADWAVCCLAELLILPIVSHDAYGETALYFIESSVIGRSHQQLISVIQY